jgi:general secretion pathway protein J
VRLPQPQREAGFTLVELLVALIVAGLLTAMVFGGVKLGLRAWARSRDTAAEASDLWAVETVLRRTLGEAYPTFASTQLNDTSVAFAGDGESLALVAPLPQALGAGIPARMRFFLVPDGASEALVMAWRLDLPGAESGEAPPEAQVRLLDHVGAIHFDYFGPIALAGAPVWQAQWSGRNRLPDLVRLRIERDRSTLPAWPDLVVGPKATITAACVYDPVSGGCGRTR